MRFRFANGLRASIDVDEDGRISGYGQLGRGHLGMHTLRFAGVTARVPAAAFADLRPEPVMGDGWPLGTTAADTAAESALERTLTQRVMTAEHAPEIRRVAQGEPLVIQGERGDELFVLLDGVLSVECDAEVVGQAGPGSVVGEQALFNASLRTCTLRASTPCRVAVFRASDVDRAALVELDAAHRSHAGGTRNHAGGTRSSAGGTRPHAGGTRSAGGR